MLVKMRLVTWMRFCALILVAVLGLLSVATDAASATNNDTSVSPSSTTSSTRSRSSSRRSMTWFTHSRTSSGTNTNYASITLTDTSQMSATNSVSPSILGTQTKTAGSVTRSSSKLDGSITATGNSRSTTRFNSTSATTSDSMTASLSAPKGTSTPSTSQQTRYVSSTTSLSKSLLSIPTSKTFTISTTSSVSRSITVRVPPTTTKTRSNSRSMAQSVTNSPSRDPMSHSWSLSSSSTLSNSSVLTNTLHSLSITVSPTIDDSITASHTETDPRTTSHTESTSMLASSLTESASATQSPSQSVSESTMLSRSLITLTTSTTLTVTTKTVTVSVSLTHFITKPPTPTTTQVLSESKASSSLSATGTASVSGSVTYSLTVSASLNLTSDTSSVSSSVTTTLSATKATPSLSVSRFMSASRTLTNSRKTSSRSSSSARSSTRSVSQSVTGSVSVSTTTTTTLSFSLSPSHNATMSATITPPPTPSRSITLRLTPSATFSNNFSVSTSVSFSQTFTQSASSFLSQSRSTSAVVSRSTTGSTSVTVPSRSRSGRTHSPTYTRSTTRDHTQTPTASKSRSTSRSLSLSRTASPSSSTTFTTSDTLSLTKSMSADSTTTLTIYFSVTHNPTPTASPSITLSHEHSRSGSSSVSISQTVSSTITSSLSGETVSNEATTTASSSPSTSSTASASSTPTETDSPSITIDPCNTTFRANSTDFIDSIQVAGNVLAFSPVYLDDQYILKMNRVQFTLLDSIQVDVNFNTYLRNFYYDVGQQWFAQPNVQGCRVMSAEPLNATSLRYRVQYDPDVVLRLSVHDNLVCNVTFSTDIFQCQLVTNLTFNFSLAILATSMDPWISDSALQAVNSITTILTTAMGAVSMLAQSRAAALMALSTCQFSIVDPIGFPDNIFDLAIGTLENRYYRGTVIGNLERTSSTKPSRSFVSTFSEYLLSSYGDRLLVQLLQPNSRVGSLAARCLRLLIQVAPFYRFAAFGLVQHFPSLSKMLKLCVTLASDLDGNRDVVTQVVRVETSLAVTLCLAQDPRARQLLDSQLIEHPHYTSQLRSALLSNLNSAALDYYEDVFIIDAVGDLITHVDAVEWETVGPMSPIATAARPTKQSVSELFERQEHKWSTSPALDDHIDAGQRQHHLGNRRMQLQTTRPVSDLQRAQLQRLAFILVTYAAHRTLGQHLSSQAPRSHSSQTYDESPMVDVSPISAAWVPPTESGPVPTRSSMLREWGAHPHKAGAVMRAAETIRESGQTTMNYASDSFAVASGRTEVLSATGAAKVVPRQGAPQQRRTTQQNISIQYTNTARRVSPHRSGSVAHRTTTTRRYTKFDHALKLAMQFAQYFRGAGSGGGATTSSVQAIATFETNGNGFARRVPQSQTTASSSHQDPSSSLGPGSLPPPSSSQQRSWSVDQLKEGDLFFFSLQILDVSHHSLEQVRARAIRHLNVIKKAFVVTPQAAKSRRWFLFDMATHILPGIIHVISQLIELFVLHGDETAKFPIVLFREQALRDEEGDHGNGAASSSELHAGNLLEVLDQVRFYFSNVTKANPTIAAGSPQRSTYLADLENKIAILSAKKFDGRSEVPAAAAENGAFSLHEPSASTASRRAHDVSPSLRMPRSFQYDSDEDDV